MTPLNTLSAATALSSPVAAYILAGGRSSRMGTDKALLEIGGRTLLHRACGLAAEAGLGVTVVGAPAKYEGRGGPGVRVIEDRLPAAGPLAGIDAALLDTSAPWNLILGCDLPFLNVEWLSFLVQRAQGSSAGAIVPLNTGGPEPLCAVYSLRCQPIVAAALDRGVRKVTDIYTELQIDYLQPADWKPFDLHGLLFKNVNTPQDYESLTRTQIQTPE